MMNEEKICDWCGKPINWVTNMLYEERCYYCHSINREFADIVFDNALRRGHGIKGRVWH